MRISVKGRYGLASMITLAEHYPDDYMTIASISGKLGISKIYLEQVFSLLKRANLVTSIKGAQGGYQLAKPPKEITLYQILSATELTLLEKTEVTIQEKEPILEHVLQTQVFHKLDQAVASVLENITLDTLLENYRQGISDTNYMYYI